MRISSPTFENGKIIPSLFTCEGKNCNPELIFHEVPAQAKSLVLLMDDPDAPKGTYDHWVVYNMPPETTHLPANTKPPGIQGKNTNGENGYIGPCPPDREHRYFFKLFALDTLLDLPAGVSKERVLQALRSHVIAECELMGRYELKKGY
jgi:Raf kinase inhibitor-like YbhB/YbcL family protein